MDRADSLEGRARTAYKGVKKAVIGFTGGLDTTVSASLLKAAGVQLVTVSLELGGRSFAKEAARKAKELQVARHFNVNVLDEFLRHYVARAIRANMLHDGELNSEALSRPLIAAQLVATARREGADAVAHSSHGTGNDQLRFETLFRSLAPDLRVLAPLRDLGVDRGAEVAYVRRKKLAVEVQGDGLAVDENAWGRSVKGGPLEAQDKEVPESVFVWTRSPEKGGTPEYAEITFSKGGPVSMRVLDARKKVLETTSDVILRLNQIAGAHGVGRLDHMEDRAIGLKTREIYEAPAAVTLITAHRDLEKFVLTAKELAVKEQMDRLWADLLDDGNYFSSMREWTEAFIDASQRTVEGTVTVKLHHGSATPVARSSRFALYDPSLRKGLLGAEESAAFSRIRNFQEIIAHLIREKS